MQCDKTTAVAEGAGIIADSWSNIGEDMRGQVAQSMGIKAQNKIIFAYKYFFR